MSQYGNWYDPWYDQMETLDEKILSGFQTITEKAHKIVGWTKHDLSHLCVKGAAVASTGSGTYSFTLGYLGDNPSYGYFSMALGVASAGLGYFMFAQSKKQKEIDERKELSYIKEHGAAMPPEIKAGRPFNVALVAAMGIQALLGLRYGYPETPDWLKSVDRTQYTLLLNLFSINMVGYFGATISRDYFRSTTMFPPQKERNILQRLKNALPGKPAEAKVKI